jgi:predicted CoA-binding protein
MSWRAPTDAEVKSLLQSSKNVAIVGISNKENRASYQVAKWLKENSHFNLFFVNPVIEEVLGEKTYPSLAEIPVTIDIVDVFRRPEDCPPVLDKAITAGAKAIWLQLGIANEEVAGRGTDAGLDVVMDRCIKVDYDNLL